ncbi:MAG: tetratricopeptide repeat protein [Deltaproteobacteria bacterium]|nr:tetratricopeptide repeat protein [Deltaproteobacteria bacterium]
MNVIFALILFLLLPILSPVTTSFAHSERTRHSELSFADSLYQEGDYYRAVTEYKRFLHYQPNHPEAPRAQLNMARCFLHGEQWHSGEKTLTTLIQQYPHSPESDYAAVLYAETAYKQHNFSRTLERLSDLNTSQKVPQLLSHQTDLRLWSLASLGEYDQLIHDEQQFPDHSLLSNDDFLQLNQLPLKSPKLAGVLSAIIPGSGQLYAGRYREAGMSLLLNAAFLGGGIQSIKTGNHVVGGILLFFEAGWYGGNIYNAMNSVHKYNRDLQQSALSQLIEQCNFSLLLDDKTTGFQMTGHF